MHRSNASVMTADVKTCAPEDTLLDAARIMREANVGALPVVNRARQPVGMITDRDVTMKAMEAEIPLSGFPVKEAMTRPVVCCHQDDPVTVVERTMCTNGVRRVPIVDDNKQLTGTISLSDLALAAKKRPDGHQLDRDEVAAVLRAVVEHRP